MARLSIEQQVTTPSTLNYLTDTAYDYTKWNVGKGLIYNAGSTAVDKYIAPQFDAIRPMEESTAFASMFTAVHSFSATTDYLFGLETTVAAASATRRVHLWTVNKKTGVRSWNGFITLTLASATAHTARDFKIDVKNETTGTVTVSGTAVTGSSTAFTTNGVAVGARIGFGSTDPTQISTWYRVSAVGSTTSITLGTTGPTLGSPTPYVIQEFRPVFLATNATTTNGGIHYGKGISIDDFTSGGTTIAIAVATDGVKAMYWLKDAASVTNITGAGMALDTAAATATSLTCYVVDLVSAGNYKFFTYNLRAASLSLASGATTTAWLLATGSNAFTGTGSQNGNLTLATAGHGTGSGVKSLYTTTTSRIYRVPVTQITTTSTTVFSSPSDNIIEVSPGGSSTFTAPNILTTIAYMSDCDMFIVGTTHATSNYSYVTQYVASGAQFTKMFGRDYKYLEQSAKDNGHPTIFSNQITLMTYHVGGSNLIYATKQGTTITTNHVYIMAFGADWDYASTSSGRLISPQMTTANASKYYRAFVNNINYIGTTALGKGTEPFRMYARTANITSDATTGWTVLDETNDISGFTGASSIQFAIEFKTIGEGCLPTRILGVNVEYEDTTTDSHYALSVAKSSVSSKIFAFWFKTAFGSTVPSLTITLYNADTGGLIMTDTTVASASGTWQKTTDGTSWNSYDTNDKGSSTTTWIRYTPTSLSDNVKVAAYLTQT